MHSRAIRLSPAALLLLSALGACGGDDDGGSTDLEGIYELGSWTHNPDGCDEPGPAAAEAGFYTHFFVKHESFFGEDFITTVFCDDVDECRASAAEEDTLHIGNFAFDSGSDAMGWTGSSFVLSVGETSCSGSVFEATMTGNPHASVEIDEETKTVTDVPVDDMGECVDQEAYDQAADLPCEQLTVVGGIFLEEI